MGVIHRQVFKNNLLSYLALGVGVLAQLFIYPQNPALKGHADTLLKAALLIYPFLMLGMTTVMVRFLPYLRGAFAETNAQLFTRAVVVAGGALAFLGVVNLFFGKQLFDLMKANGYVFEKLQNNNWTIWSLLVVMMGAALVTTLLTNYKRIAIPVLFNNLLLKMGLPVIFLLFIYGYYDREGFNLALVVLYALAWFGLLGYAAYLGGLKLRWGKLDLKEKTTKDLYSLAGFSILGSLGSVLAVHIDTLSVNAFMGDTSTGYYGFAVFAVTIITIPYKAVNSITSPIVAEAWQKQDMNRLAELYQESAKVLFAAGSFVFVGLVICLPYLYQLTDNMGQYSVGYLATILLGIGILFDQLTSINNSLFIYTDYYRWSILFVIIMGGLNVFLNYLFIGILGYGLAGAAGATMLALIVYNLLKAIFIYWKMNIHSLSLSALYTALVGLLAGSLAWLIPDLGIPIINILIRGLTISLIFWGYLRYTDGVPPVKRALQGGLKKLF